MPCSASASRSWPSTTRGRAARRRSIRLPSVVALRKYQRSARRVAFTRFNVFLRDRFTCQYCGEVFASSALTFEHVIPRSRGGQTTWSNIVTACVPVQHGQGQLAAHQAAAPAEGADAQRAAGGQARVSARLSARELDGLPLLGRAARGLDQLRLVAQWIRAPPSEGGGRAFKSRRDVHHLHEHDTEGSAGVAGNPS